MTDFAVPQHAGRSPGLLDRTISISLLGAVVLAALVALFLRPDQGMNLLSGHLPAWGAALVAVMACAGIGLSGEIGLSLDSTARSPLVAGVGVAAVMCVLCGAADVLFKPLLSAAYLQTYATVPLLTRIMFFGANAVFQCVVYRLFVGPALIWLGARALGYGRGERLPMRLYLAGFGLAQVLNVSLNSQGLMPPGVVGAGYLVLRLLAPGLLWGYSYARFGFKTTEVGAFSVHILFQPIMGVLLG